MLYEAAGPDPGEPDPGPEAVLADPKVAVYLEGWGREGDWALIATDAGRSVGAVWMRLYEPGHHGWGFIDATIPEIALAVVEDFRGRGAGRALLAALVAHAREEGFSALSLSTIPMDTLADRLYKSQGFRYVGENKDLSVMRLDL